MQHFIRFHQWLTTYLQMPSVFPVAVDTSMEALPADSRIRQIYPDDLFPNGKVPLVTT